jgi:hypothetical protein
MDLAIMYSQALDVKILEKPLVPPPTFLSHNFEQSVIKKNAACQIWARLSSTDMLNGLEEKINKNIEGKEFNDCMQIYSATKLLIDADIAVRVQDGHKWSQVGDFEPK